MSKNNGKRRVVVTGQGVVTPVGTGVGKFWKALKNGECGIAEAKGYSTDDLMVKIGGEVKDFVLEERIRDNIGQIQRSDKFTQYAYASAVEAVEQSGLVEPKTGISPLADGHRASAIFGCGSPGISTLEEAYHDLFKLDKRRANPLTLLKSLGSTAPATVSMKYQITGPVFTVVSACSSATHAMGLTFRMIRDGMLDLGITGGSEASLAWGTQRAWEALFVLSPDGCFPFSKRRNGTVLAEGGGMMVFEELEHAKARGAEILAEVKGFGMTADAGDMVNPKIEGPSTAMREALDEAGLAPTDIDYINAHGTATRVNDINETRAIKEVFGKHAYELSISSTKSMHGHLLGGSGAVEGVASVMALRENFVPPTINFEEPCEECDLDYTPNKGKKREINHVLSNSLAFGGLNTVLIFGPAPE